MQLTIDGSFLVCYLNKWQLPLLCTCCNKGGSSWYGKTKENMEQKLCSSVSHQPAGAGCFLRLHPHHPCLLPGDRDHGLQGGHRPDRHVRGHHPLSSRGGLSAGQFQPLSGLPDLFGHVLSGFPGLPRLPHLWPAGGGAPVHGGGVLCVVRRP